MQSEFVDISPYAISENERIVDIKRLDLNHLLLLTENQLIVYDILKGTITLQLKCDDTLGTVFTYGLIKNSINTLSFIC